MFPVPWSSKWNWSLHLFLGRPMFLRPFGLYCNACLGILFVSILCTCCSHFSWYCFISFTIFSAPVFSLIHWSCAQLSDRVWGPPRLLSSVYLGFFSKGTRLERETDPSPPYCPRLIRNWVTYCHFLYVKSGSSIPAGQIRLLSFTYEFYATLVQSLGQGIGHAQP